MLGAIVGDIVGSRWECLFFVFSCTRRVEPLDPPGSGAEPGG